ncbi:MAG: phosphoesterase, partial [Methylocapsa sp.]|nr:phosphoesterase [Methylocapsa sp.]
MGARCRLAAFAAILGATGQIPATAAGRVNEFNHIVVIIQENHSFDNLYGLWGDVNGEAVNGLNNADAVDTRQVEQDGTPYKCLPQLDVNLTSPPLAPTCTGSSNKAPFQSAFANGPFMIDNYIAPKDTTCPPPGARAPKDGIVKGSGLPGGCTRDLIHAFYNEQYQIDRGRQDRYVTGSDAAGLVMGYNDTTKLPVYGALHRPGAPNYVVADAFFHAAFGGSFLNHQWLIAAATPVLCNALNDGSERDLHSIIDSNGMPGPTPFYRSPPGAVTKSGLLTISCDPPPGRPPPAPDSACGDYAVGTFQPFYWPYSPGAAEERRLPPLTNPTIGDRLSAAGIDWAWYSGGWSNAIGDIGAPGWTNGGGPSCADPNADPRPAYPRCPDKLFQYHHQPFNYYASFAPGTAARAQHLRDEAEFLAAANEGTLKPVSFVKPIGGETEHPGFTDESEGDTHLVRLVDAVVNGPQAEDTLIIVTYDEFGGQWDHVPPPPYGRLGAQAGASDQWGPGTRVPA